MTSPNASRRLLDDLWAKNCIRLRRAPIFDATPTSLDLDLLRREQRIEGMLLGVAAGDALGHSTEWTYEPERRRREFGTIVDHVGTAVSLPGRISDDTQFSFWTIESLLQTGELDPEALARYFVERKTRVVGMGRNTAKSLTRHADRLRDGKPLFHECVGDPSVEGRGNGTVMRVAPLLLPHLRSPSPNLYADLAIGAFITHGHAAALAATVAMGHLLWQMLLRKQGDAPAAEWWLDEYVRIASQLEESQPRYPPAPDPHPEFLQKFDGSLAEYIDKRVRSAWRQRLPLHEAFSLKGFGSGADCFQSVPAILYTLMHHADDLSSAVIAAVNDTKDNDTVASVVAAFCGALHGRRAIRQKWIDGISSSSLKGPSESDRLLVERLTDEARARFLDGEKLSKQPKWLF